MIFMQTIILMNTNINQLTTEFSFIISLMGLGHGVRK